MAKPSRKVTPPDESEALAAQIVEMMMSYGQAQFGDAVKAYWVYAGDLCPGCLKRPIDAMKYKGKEGLAINSFIYRERGVLIGYLLCSQCAKGIYEAAPRPDDELHQNIERNLIAAYHRYLASLDA
jgi:hypothetical protein